MAPVDRARDEVGALLVEDAPSHLVDDQAGRPRQRADHPGGVAAPGRPREAVPGLGRLEIVRLGPPEAALVAVRLGQVGLPDAPGADEGDVPTRVQVGQRRELPERAGVPTPCPREVEVAEGPGLPPGKPARPGQRLDCGLLALLDEVGKQVRDGGRLAAAEITVGRECRQFLGADREPECGRTVADDGEGAGIVASHRPTIPPRSNFAKAAFPSPCPTCAISVAAGCVGSSSGWESDHWPSQTLSTRDSVTSRAAGSRAMSSEHACR